ncbi:MAG: GerMN domain-containing protein [Oscillospiraceae bacterium]
MKRLIPNLLIIALMCSCASSSTDSVYSVYRVIAQPYQTNGQLMITEPVEIGEDETVFEALLNALTVQPTDARLYNPLAGIEVVSFNVTEGSAVLELGRGYLELKGITKTLADACCALTLCELSDIDRLSISVDGELVTQGLTASDMYLSGTGSEPYQREICLYFANESGTLLVPEYRTLSISNSAQPERYVVEELLRIPNSSDLRSPIPEGTELLGITHNGRSCILNLSGEFLENKPKTATGEVLAVYSLVNSLTSLGTVNDVMITVEGKTIGKYVNLSLDKPLAGLDFIAGSRGSSDSELEARLYFAYDDKLFGAPCVIDQSQDVHQTLLDKLMSSKDFGGYTSLFNVSDRLSYTGTEHGICTVTVSRSFFERRTPKEADLAIDALCLTLIELDDVSAVQIRYSDGTIPLTPNRDLSSPVMQITANTIE